MLAGLVALVLSVLATAYIQWPRTFIFSLEVTGMDNRIDAGESLSQMTRNTSLGLADAHKANKKSLGRLHTSYSVGLFALVAEVVVLLVDLTRR